MQLVYFLLFIGVCSGAVYWATRKSRKQNALDRQQRRDKAAKTRAELLTTPPDYLLSHPKAVWSTKRRRGTEDVIATNRFTPKSESSGGPEYDGYSRRDRHHVVVGTAYIKEEDHIEEPATTTAAARKHKGAR
jgi:hypothetical protein